MSDQYIKRSPINIFKNEVKALLDKNESGAKEISCFFSSHNLIKSAKGSVRNAVI